MDKTNLILGAVLGTFVLLLIFLICFFPTLLDNIKYRRRQKHKDNPWLKKYLDILERQESAYEKYHNYEEMYKARVEYLHEHVLFDTPKNLEPIKAQVRELEPMIAEAESKYKACCDEMDAHTTDGQGHCCKEYLYFF